MLVYQAPQFIGPGLVLFLGVQGHHNETAAVHLVTGIHVGDHAGYLQQSGHAGCVAVGPGIETAVEHAQVVIMGHQDDVTGGKTASGNEADDIAGQAV